MQRHLRSLVAVLGLASTAHCQYTVPATTGPGGLYSFGQITGPGAMNSVVSYGALPAPPSSHSLQFVVTGTAPTACALELDGSNDGSNWFPISAQGVSCVASNAFSVTNHPFAFIRVYVSAYTKGDSTTVVTVTYNRGVV